MYNFGTKLAMGRVERRFWVHIAALGTCTLTYGYSGVSHSLQRNAGIVKR
jgi:hypothetical protein